VETLLLAEYERIKEEQRSRIGFRDNLLYVTLATMAAIIAATLQSKHRVQLLLLLPPASSLLGWTYLVNDEKISAIGRYVREVLAPRLATLTQAAPDVRIFGWEAIHRDDSGRTLRKWLQLAADLLAFSVAPMIAIIVYWAAAPWHAYLFAASVAEAGAIIILGWQIVAYADLGRSQP
jgi:hypothetical protein